MKENNPSKHYWLYVLLLKEGKYYIGITTQKYPSVRIHQHMNGFYTAQWVRKYPFVKLLEVINLGDITEEESNELELKKTLQYMKKYGYQNVRGGKLNYSGKYVKIGNRFWRDEDFSILIGILLMTFALIVAFLKIY